MATKLDKDISRESSITIDKKELVITLTGKQGIQLKQKGTRKKAVDISIEELWNYLNDSVVESPKKGGYSSDSKVPMISLHDLRTHSAISGLGADLTAKFDTILCSLIKEYYPHLK